MMPKCCGEINASANLKRGKKQNPSSIYHLYVYFCPTNFIQGLRGFLQKCRLDAKESAYNAGDLGLIPGLRGSPEEGNGYPLQYSCLESSMGRGAWRGTVHGIAKSQI